MEKHEVPLLSQRLAQLAEVLDGKAPSPAALLVWLDALKHVRMDDVQAAISDWPKKHTKMPVPADIVKLAGERTSARVEAAGVRNRESTGAVADMAHPVRHNPNSPVAKAELAKINDMLADCKGGLVAGHFRQAAGNSEMDPKGWAKTLRLAEQIQETYPHEPEKWKVAHLDGKRLLPIQREMWRDALGMTPKCSAFDPLPGSPT